eukprot:62357-Hanusia_phi.AAC.2
MARRTLADTAPRRPSLVGGAAAAGARGAARRRRLANQSRRVLNDSTANLNWGGPRRAARPAGRSEPRRNLRTEPPRLGNLSDSNRIMSQTHRVDSDPSVSSDMPHDTQTSGGRCICKETVTGVPAATLRVKGTRTRTGCPTWGAFTQ